MSLQVISSFRGDLLLVAVLILSSNAVVPAWCAYGGHDLFTSLAQLRALWRVEQQVVEDMQRVLENLQEVQDVFQRYIKNYKLLQLDQEPNFDYLGHPVNGYHLVRHVALGWEEVRTTVFQAENDTRLIFDRLRNRENTSKLPDLYDVEGAAFGLARLHSIYGMDTERIVADGIIESKVLHGNKNQKEGARSGPSIKKLDVWDLNLLAHKAKDNALFNTATDLFSRVIAKLDESAADKSALELFLQQNPNRTDVERESKTANKIHDEMLIRRGQRGVHRCHAKPIDPKLRNKKKFKKKFVLKDPILDEKTVEKMRTTEVSDAVGKAQVQYEMLCAGEEIRGPERDANMKCLYGHSSSPWLRLAPLKVEVRSEEPYLAVIRELMFPHECDNITAFLEPHLGFPPGRMKGGRAKGSRNDWTMKNAWPDETDNIYLEKMTTRVEHLSNLYASSKLNQSDRFMCGNYGIGGHYGIHPDYSPYDEAKFLDPTSRINRVSTVMTVLEAPEAGGATVWPYLGVSIFPEKGSAAFWFNVKSDAYVDHMTQHAACPVLLGQKWIGNKWIGYAPQWNRRPCELKILSRFKGPLPDRQ